MREIKLGDKVRCKITGFTRTAVAKTEFINGGAMNRNCSRRNF